MDSGLEPSEALDDPSNATSPSVPSPRRPVASKELHSEISSELLTHRNYTYFLILDKGWSLHDAHDIAQNVFIRYYQARAAPGFHFTAGDGGRAFVRTLVKRCIADFRRIRDRHPEDPTPAEKFPEKPLDDPAFAELDDLNKIKQFLRKHLPDNQYKAFILRHLYDYQVQEISQEMGVDRRTIRRWLDKAAETLRQIPPNALT